MLLTVKNWAEFQHYKDRNPPWIKLHKALLDDRAFQRLSDASRALAPCLWLLASESKDGIFDGSTEEVSFRVRQPEKWVDDAIKPLVSGGFFIVVQGDSKSLAACVQVAVPETETEAEAYKTTEAECAPLPKKGNGENPPVTKAGMWAIELRRLNVKTTSIHPTMLQLIEDGFELPAVIEALESARQRKPFPELIPIGYLDPIVRNPPKPAQKSWWASESATIAKGRELGIEARPGEDMDAYRDRIRTSAHA